MEDVQNGRWPKLRRPKWKTTKMEDDQNGTWTKLMMTIMEDDHNGRQPQWKMNTMEDDHNGRRPKSNSMLILKQFATIKLSLTWACLLFTGRLLNFTSTCTIVLYAYLVGWYKYIRLIQSLVNPRGRSLLYCLKLSLHSFAQLSFVVLHSIISLSLPSGRCSKGNKETNKLVNVYPILMLLLIMFF